MKEGVGKKGLSPVIASVLLILLVLVLASIIFIWARGFIGEQIEKFGEPIEDSCDAVVFEIARVGNTLEILNTGNIDIRHLEVRMTKGGETISRMIDISIDSQEFKSEGVSFSMSDDAPVVEPDEIIVYPALLGNIKGENRPYTCLDSGVVL